MSISHQEQQFAAFVLAKSGKEHLLQPIIDRCLRDGITVWKHFEEGLIQQYQYSAADAQRKVQEWYSEYLATMQPKEQPRNTPTPFMDSLAETVLPATPVNGKSRLWWWLLPLVVLGGGAAYYYWFIMKPAKKSPQTLYVLTEDGLILRSNTNCDSAKNKKIANIAYNKPVELAEAIDSSRNWVKVRIPGTTTEGYIAEYRMLGPAELNRSLDSIYRDRAWNPQAERLSYPLKKSLYQYIRNTNFEWFVDPVTDNTSFQTVVDLSRKKYGKAQINDCALTSYTKFRVAILTNRSTGYKKAMIFSLASNYNSEKIDELDLSSLADPIMYKTSSDVYITESRDKEAKKYVIGVNSSGAPVFKVYEKPFNPLDFFNGLGQDEPAADTTGQFEY